MREASAAPSHDSPPCRAGRPARWRRFVNRASSWVGRRASWREDVDFVTASYLELLGRVPDPEGLAAALRGLEDGALRRRHLLRQLRASGERQAYLRATDELGVLLAGAPLPEDAEFVAAAFERLLERAPDPETLAAAVDRLRCGRTTRAYVVETLLESAEGRALPHVKRLYRDLLGRDPTRDERWRGFVTVSEAGMDPAALERRIRRSIELTLRYAPAPAGVADAPPPRDVWLELTTRCNVVPPCVMCGYSLDPASRERRDLDPEVWRRLLPWLRQADTVGLHGGGEPLLSPSLFPLLSALDPARTDVGFNSNGHLLGRETSRRLVEAGLGWISVSLDAATPETYLRVRRRPDFERLLGKIRGLVAERRALGASRPDVEVNMTLMRLNLAEAPRFVELAAGLGLSRVMFQQLQPGGRHVLTTADGTTFDYDEQLVARCPALHDEMVGRARERARELGVEVRYEIAYESAEPPAPRPGSGLAPLRCPEPWSRLLVGVTGDAYFCCGHLSNGVSLGDTGRVPIEEIWNGRRARLLRALVDTQPHPECCRGCFRVHGSPSELPPVSS